MGKVLSFGELLLRICPDSAGEWLADNTFPVYVGGAEANVAAALSLWEVPSAYLTAVPDNFIARQLVGYLDDLHIDTSAIHYSGERIGLYFLDKGKDLKNAGVIYDRNYSSFSALTPGTIDWDKVLEGVTWFHFSAICPAINQAVAEVCEEALKAAAERNITISIDLNYRAKLWKFGKEPIEILPGLVKYCDVVMGNIWAAEKMLGIPVPENVVEEHQKQTYLQQSEISSKAILDLFPKCKSVANTFRFDHGKGIQYYTTLYTQDQLLVSKEFVAEAIAGKVGSGDCYMAGLIYGFYHQLEAQEVVDFATSAAFAKLFTESDFNTTRKEDIRAIVEPYEMA
ncbi:PfkB family carbohydrate kinase [Pedobacter sp. AW31-3R]|uniref:PfkB family carbohydrate kinase n=1 Tax=Pedobacter sp. AW31-3R TaxID=3445781 RepID=UPI003F9FAE4F